MGGDWDVVAVAVIVAAAAVWAGHRLWRTARRKQICTSCAASGGCPLADGRSDKPLGSECTTEPPHSS